MRSGLRILMSRFSVSRDTLSSLLKQLTAVKRHHEVQKLHGQLAAFNDVMTLEDILTIVRSNPKHAQLCGCVVRQTCQMVDQGSAHDVVYILDKAIMPGIEVSPETLTNAQCIVENLSRAELSPETCSLLISVLGKLSLVGTVPKKEIIDRLSGQLKLTVRAMTNEQLGQVAIGMGLSAFQDESDWSLLDAEALNRKLTYYDHMRIATGFGFLGLGSEQFWRGFVDHLLESVDLLMPDILTQSLLTLSQCHRGQPIVYAKLERRFLHDYQSYDQANRTSVYASFARVQEGSDKLWLQFEKDFEELLGAQTPEDLGSLTLEFLKVHQLLAMWVVDRLVEMAMQNTKGMSECTAQALLDALEKSNLK